VRTEPFSQDPVSAVLLHAEQWRVVQAGAAPEAMMGRRVPPERRAWSLANTHVNGSLEILLSVRGDDWFGMDGRMHPCRPGRLFLIDPGVPHDVYYPETVSGLEHIWMRVFSDRVFVTWLAIDRGRYARLHEHLTVLHQEQLGLLTAPFGDGVRVSQSPFVAIRLRLLVAMIAAHLAEHADDPAARAVDLPPKTESIQANVAAAIRRHIDDTAGRGVTLASLAHFSGYSTFHLSRLFRAWSGCSIHQYINAARQRKMAAMTREGATNGAIAEVLGFSETSAFLRWRRLTRNVRRDADV